MDGRHHYIQTREGWLYLAIVLDLFNQRVVGWSIKLRMTADIVTDALTMAWFRRKPSAGVLFHSDRGSQYASQAMAQARRYGMTASMSRRAIAGTTPTESFFSSLKNERVHGAIYATDRRSGRPVRVHRGVLQQVAATPRWTTARRFGSSRTGSASMSISNPSRHKCGRWKAKFDGLYLTQPDLIFR